jgi:Flp pilus assembly protein TadB
MAADRQHYALQTIFSFFLGLMVLAFVGVGVNTFYPQPAETSQKAQQDISRKMEALNGKTANRSLTATEQAELARLQDQQNALQDKTDAAMKTWARNTSIILVLFATLVMVISLTLSDQLRVISNGLLLGGLFTMIYGVGWVIFSGNSTARFVVILFALAVALALGYVKFVRQRKSSVSVEGAPGDVALDDAQLAGLAARVEALEARAAAAAAALGGEETPR